MATLTQEQLPIFRDALSKARQDLEMAEQKKSELVNEELELGRQLWQLRRLIDALELLLGDVTEKEVAIRNRAAARPVADRKKE